MSNTDTASSAPTHKEISIGDKENKMSFLVPIRYYEGHVVNANEANVLNQIMRENLGNNWRTKVQAFLKQEEGAHKSEDELRADFDKYVAEYQFSQAGTGTGRAALSPLEREARKIAKAVVIQMLARPTDQHPQGRKPKDIDAEKFEAEVARFAETEKVQALAKKNLKAQEKAINDLLSDDTVSAAA